MPRNRNTPASEQEAHETTAETQEQTTPAGVTEAPVQEVAADTPSMKIDVRITSTRNAFDDPTRATASVVLGDCFVIKGFRVVKGENGLFCSMPSRRLRDGEYSEVCHAITPEFAKRLNASVLSEYQVYLAQQMAESQETPHIYEPEQGGAPAAGMEIG